MFTLKEVIIVEGRYDKIKLSNFIDSPIFVTNGFSVFNNKESQKAIRNFAKTDGIVILTDSDSAGLKIRAFVKQLALEGNIFDAYVPEIEGKERRKTTPGKEGILGVEGITEEIIIKALLDSGATIKGEKKTEKKTLPITKNDLYILGLSGRENSQDLRKKILKELGLPTKMSSNMLVSVISRRFTKDEFAEFVEKVKKL